MKFGLTALRVKFVVQIRIAAAVHIRKNEFEKKPADIRDVTTHETMSFKT
jgi:hypothetical protein